MASVDSSLYRFSDAPAVPDLFHTKDYSTMHRGKGTAIVIDNGSCQCRVGWANEAKPRMVFRNAVARTRGKKGEADYICVGNDITNVEAVRSTLRSQFDHNLVTNFSNQEQVFDYSFSHLGLGEEPSVDHPVVLTEAVCNPSYCRSLMSELLFEAYAVPAVSYGVDSLFSAYYHFSSRGLPTRDALVVSSSFQSTHVLPLVDGMFDAKHCKRLNVGGAHTVGYMQRLLQLKYPAMQSYLTLSRAQELVARHCYLAVDYGAELQSWLCPGEERDVRLIQLPYTQAVNSLPPDSLSKEDKDKMRKQKAREQLLKLNRRKREQKIEELQEQFHRLMNLRQLEEEVDPEEYLAILEDADLPSTEALDQIIKRLQADLEKEQRKLASFQQTTPDLPQVDAEWLESLKQRRKELLEQQRARQQQKREFSKRRSAASTNRMKIISQLAEDVPVKKSKKKEDTFGMNDEDWNVYRKINIHASESDNERDEAEIAEISKLLEKHDPTFSRGAFSSQSTDIASCYQLQLGVERFRVPEIVFQPAMIGVDQCGVTEAIDLVLQCYAPAVQQRLVDNVFVTGGNTLFENFNQRLEKELLAIRPFCSTYTVKWAEDRLLDAWRGAAIWANADENKPFFISQADFLENGSDYFKDHTFSNPLSPGSSKNIL